MCLFMRSFSSTEFNSFPSAQQCLCGPEASTQPLASFHKLERQLFRGRGSLDVGWEGAAGREGGGPVAWKLQGTREEAEPWLWRGQGGQVLQRLLGLVLSGDMSAEFSGWRGEATPQ